MEVPKPLVPAGMGWSKEAKFEEMIFHAIIYSLVQIGSAVAMVVQHQGIKACLKWT